MKKFFALIGLSGLIKINLTEIQISDIVCHSNTNKFIVVEMEKFVDAKIPEYLRILSC
jgi:hypothetical protein